MKELRDRFRALHASGTFIMPNAWDAGSARLLVSVGFPAIATTSSGHAAALGKLDQTVTLEELIEHVRQLASAVEVPINVDAERCFADDVAGVGRSVERIAEAGAAGISIEDYDPARDAIEPLDVAVERAAAAAEAAHRHGVTLTARAENHLYGIGELDDTIERLRAYRSAGADVVYAPGLAGASDIGRLVAAVEAPVNVLAMRQTPSVAALAELGVRRVSTGGGPARAAYGALLRAARELATDGTSTYLDRAITGAELESALRRS